MPIQRSDDAYSTEGVTRSTFTHKPETKVDVHAPLPFHNLAHARKTKNCQEGRWNRWVHVRLISLDQFLKPSLHALPSLAIEINKATALNRHFHSRFRVRWTIYLPNKRMRQSTLYVPRTNYGNS